MGYLLHIPTLRKLEGMPLMTEDFSTKEKAFESIKHYHYIWWPRAGMFYLGKYERTLRTAIGMHTRRIHVGGR